MILENLKAYKSNVKLAIARTNLQDLRDEHFELGNQLGIIAMLLTSTV